MNLYSPLDAFPDPWNSRFLTILVAASAATTITLCVRAGSDAVVPGFAALVLSVVVVFLSPRFLQRRSGTPFPTVLKLGFAPLMLALPFIFTAVLMGDMGAGGYPAAITVFYALVVISTRELELRARARMGKETGLPVHNIYHRPLTWISTIFFFFGVLTLWPWLGQIYGTGYLWILVIGVLTPVLFFWNRLRQPRKHDSMDALIRFNRLVPYIGLILLVAFLVG
jgi:hypothetical protein